MPRPSWETLVADLASNKEETITVDVSYKLFGKNGYKAIADGLKVNTNLKILNVAGNELKDEGALMICQAILENEKSSVNTLDLSENEITEALTDSVEQLQARNIAIFLSGNPIMEARTTKRRKTKRSKRDGKKGESKKKEKLPKPLRQSDTALLNEPQVSNPRKKLLEARLKGLQEKEDEYLAQIEDLEARAKDLSKGGKLSLLNSVFSPRRSKTAMTVSTKSIIVTQRIAGGGGSSAEIYSCLVDGWSVVMKELATSAMSQGSVEAFSREIRLLELLPPHENIVRYLFHEVKDNYLRLFMTQYDCCLGQYIREIKEQGNKIPLKTIYKILLDIARGIEFLHGQDIMHRDLKSDNIFVLYGERKEIQLCAIGDFDTAKQQANTKTVLGTPSWMAPEVMSASSTEGYSFPCDIYSFGMIIYELMTLQIPFHDCNAMRIPMLVMQGKKPELPDDLPTEYEDLVSLFEQCSAHEPADRPLPSKLKTRIALSLANQ